MAERNCKKCFHYEACKEVASHSGYGDIYYTESQCKHFKSTADVVPRAVVWEMVEKLKARLPVISPCVFDNIAREVWRNDKMFRGGKKPPIEGYQSPVEICMGQIRSEMHTEQEKEILRVVQECGIFVDKDELIRALQYDREQYAKGHNCGYFEGYERARAEVAREIFAEIEEWYMEMHTDYRVVMSRSEFAELKKKYTEGGTE